VTASRTRQLRITKKHSVSITRNKCRAYGGQCSVVIRKRTAPTSDVTEQCRALLDACVAKWRWKLQAEMLPCSIVRVDSGQGDASRRDA